SFTSQRDQSRNTLPAAANLRRAALPARCSYWRRLLGRFVLAASWRWATSQRVARGGSERQDCEQQPRRRGRFDAAVAMPYQLCSLPVGTFRLWGGDATRQSMLPTAGRGGRERGSATPRTIMTPAAKSWCKRAR